MICFPNAKINIGLHVTEKRPDGYHNLDTLFYPTKLYDVLEIIEDPSSKDAYQWSSSGIPIDGAAEDNLCIKALLLLKQFYDIPPVKIHLHKVIPFGAGLGGGSSDAAFTLTTLNDMFNLSISNDKLIKYATEIGADCAFFIINSPCIATGIGNVLQQKPIDLSGYFLLLLKPNIHISTPEAYSGIHPKQPKQSLSDTLNNPINTWKNSVANDFENSVFPHHPTLKHIKNKLYEEGALYASMTGSGAAIFGIFDHEPPLLFPEYFCWSEKL